MMILGRRFGRRGWEVFAGKGGEGSKSNWMGGRS